MIKLYGKQGELIDYDIMIESRLSTIWGTTCSVQEFIDDFTTLPAGKNLFPTGLEIELIKNSQNSATVFVHQCDWARYFRDHHPTVDYLLVCSTNEIAFKAFYKKKNDQN